MRSGLAWLEDYVDGERSDVIEMLFASGRADVAGSGQSAAGPPSARRSATRAGPPAWWGRPRRRRRSEEVRGVHAPRSVRSDRHAVPHPEVRRGRRLDRLVLLLLHRCRLRSVRPPLPTAMGCGTAPGCSRRAGSTTVARPRPTWTTTGGATGRTGGCCRVGTTVCSSPAATEASTPIVVPALDLVVVRSGDSEAARPTPCWDRCSPSSTASPTDALIGPGGTGVRRPVALRDGQTFPISRQGPAVARLPPTRLRPTRPSGWSWAPRSPPCSCRTRSPTSTRPRQEGMDHPRPRGRRHLRHRTP